MGNVVAVSLGAEAVKRLLNYYILCSVHTIKKLRVQSYKIQGIAY